MEFLSIEGECLLILEVGVGEIKVVFKEKIVFFLGVVVDGVVLVFKKRRFENGKFRNLR